jgi:excisionase family DNA binding protein
MQCSGISQRPSGEGNLDPMPRSAQLPPLGRNERLAAAKASRDRNDGRPLLTVAEAAGYLKVNPKTVYGLVRSGKLRSLKVDNVLRIRPSDLDAYLDGQVSS